jgi:hypothetical protein
MMASKNLFSEVMVEKECIPNDSNRSSVSDIRLSYYGKSNIHISVYSENNVGFK